MTKDEAIQFLDNMKHAEAGRAIGKEGFYAELLGYHIQALNMAIKALEQQTCEDAVSREDALMALTGEWTELTDELIHRFIRRIKKLPSVNPVEKQELCEDAVSRNLITQTLNKMDRYVADKLTLCDTDKKFPKNEVFIVDDVYEQIVEQLPSVQPERRVGHWIQTQEKDDAEPCILWECSECHKEFRSVVHKVSNYCPNCGVKMEVEQNG